MHTSQLKQMQRETDEIKEWLQSLAPKHADRLPIVLNMLRHANEDKMDEADRAICRRVLAGEITAEDVSGPKKVSLVDVDPIWDAEV